MRLTTVSLLAIGALVLVTGAGKSSPASKKRPDPSPKAVACRAEATAKFPVDYVDTGPTPGGGRTLVNRNSRAWRAHYKECMSRNRLSRFLLLGSGRISFGTIGSPAQTHKLTPAIAAGLTDKLLDWSAVIEMIDARERAALVEGRLAMLKAS